MSEVQIFKDITTEDILIGLEAESEKYTGLYVEMNNAEERKYVKDKASGIAELLKKLDRARIDKSKEFKASVEAEANGIKLRLEKANEPFTLLIDEHKAARAKILADKKAAEDRKQALIDFENDHEFGLLMNVKFDADAKEAARIQAERDDQLKLEAAADAERRLKEVEAQRVADQEKAAQDLIDAEARRLEGIETAKAIAENAELQRLEAIRLAEVKRLADVEAAKQGEIDRQSAAIEADRIAKAKAAADEAHVAAVNLSLLGVYIAAGIPEEFAIKAVKILVKNQLPHTTFNY